MIKDAGSGDFRVNSISELAQDGQAWPGTPVVALEEKAFEKVGIEVVDQRLNSPAALVDAFVADRAEVGPYGTAPGIAMVAESPNGDVVVPPTVQALLAARLDQLDASERGVLERGSVEGKIFHRGGVEALAPDEPDVSTKLMALVRQELDAARGHVVHRPDDRDPPLRHEPGQRPALAVQQRHRSRHVPPGHLVDALLLLNALARRRVDRAIVPLA